MLDFSTFYIGSADDLLAYDGSSAEASLLALYYGLINPPPPTVFSTQPDMFVVFRSNYNYSYPGFQALYSADTGYVDIMLCEYVLTFKIRDHSNDSLKA